MLCHLLLVVWLADSIDNTDIASQARTRVKGHTDLTDLTDLNCPAEPMEQREQNHVLHELCRVATEEDESQRKEIMEMLTGQVLLCCFDYIRQNV